MLPENSVIMGLSKCGEINESGRLFDKISLRNEVSWNSRMVMLEMGSGSRH